jgi:cation:H+ antiporter
MFFHLVILIVCLAGLIKSARIFVDNVILLAKRLHISTMIIGLTVVSIGTSLPELAVSVAAAVKGHAEIPLGNVVGSNICNIGVILGLTALVSPVVCVKRIVRREGFLMLLITAVFCIVPSMLFGVPRWLGGVFLFSFAVFIAFVLKGSGSVTGDDLHDIEEDFSTIEKNMVDDCDPEVGNSGIIAGKLVLSLAALLVSSEFLIRSTITLARHFNIAEHIIALSIVSVGTSLPELSVSIAAVKKNHGDILVGNILGSNISNILLIIGISALIHPIPMRLSTIKIDFPLMAFFSMLMILFLHQKNGITRGKGLILLMFYGVVLWRCVAIP